MIVDRCESTNDIAKDLAEKGAPHGTWVSARIQDSGRGRLGRVWQSQPGNLFLSWIARIDDKALWSWVPLTAALACARAMKESFPQLLVQIKWPNDLWINSSKCGGILCEAAHLKNSSFIIIGIGINCAHSPKGLDQPTTSLSEAANQADFTADDLRPLVLEKLTEAFDQLVKLGPETIRKDYEKFSALASGTELIWGVAPEFSPARHGKVIGLGDSGELIVQNTQGERVKLLAEDVKIKAAPRAGG